MTADRSLPLSIPAIRYGAGCQVLRSGHNDREGLLVLDKTVSGTHKEINVRRKAAAILETVPVRIMTGERKIPHSPRGNRRNGFAQQTTKR